MRGSQSSSKGSINQMEKTVQKNKNLNKSPVQLTAKNDKPISIKNNNDTTVNYDSSIMKLNQSVQSQIHKNNIKSNNKTENNINLLGNKNNSNSNIRSMRKGSWDKNSKSLKKSLNNDLINPTDDKKSRQVSLFNNIAFNSKVNAANKGELQLIDSPENISEIIINDKNLNPVENELIQSHTMQEIPKIDEKVNLQSDGKDGIKNIQDENMSDDFKSNLNNTVLSVKKDEYNKNEDNSSISDLVEINNIENKNIELKNEENDSNYLNNDKFLNKIPEIKNYNSIINQIKENTILSENRESLSRVEEKEYNLELSGYYEEKKLENLKYKQSVSNKRVIQVDNQFEDLMVIDKEKLSEKIEEKMPKYNEFYDTLNKSNHIDDMNDNLSKTIEEIKNDKKIDEKELKNKNKLDPVETNNNFIENNDINHDNIPKEYKNLDNFTINKITNSNDYKEIKDQETYNDSHKKQNLINSTIFISKTNETKDINTQINEIMTLQENNTSEANNNEVKIEEISILKSDNNYQNNNEDDKFVFSNINEENFNSDNREIEFNFNKDDKSVVENEINIDNDEIKEKCRKIFINFANYSKEENDFFMSQQVLVKFLKIIGLIEEKIITYADLDLIIVKVTGGKKLNLLQFNNFLIKLSQHIDPNNFKVNPRKSCMNIINTLFDPYLEFIQKEIDQNESTLFQWNSYVNQKLETIIDNYDVTFHVSSLLKSIYNNLKIVYSAYFENELLRNANSDQSFTNYIQFIKDFEIIPLFINMNQAATYWKIVNNLGRKSKIIFDYDIGKNFTLSKFSMMIVHFSSIAFNKINQNYIQNITNHEKLLFFLEKLENSNGFTNYESRTTKRLRVSLIPDKNTVKLIIPASNSLSFSVANDNNKSSLNSILSPKRCKEVNDSIKTNMDYDINEILSVSKQIKDLIEDKSDLLREIFSKYSNLGDKLTMNKMNMTGFMKFLKDCNLIHSLTTNLNTTNGSVNIFSTRSVSPKKSMLSIFNIPNDSNSSISKKNKSILKGSKNQMKGKLLESDAQMIFNNLTGSINFDKSKSIKTHFDKNKGFTTNFNYNNKVSNISPNKTLSSTKINSSSLMDYNLFVKSLEYISKNIYSEKDIDDAFTLFLENNIGKLLHNDKQVSEKNKVLEILQNIRQDEIINLIRELHDIILVHYVNYSENEYMGFGNFYKFYKDFSLFPSIVSLIQIKAIFKELADIFSNHLKSNVKNQKSRNNEIENKTQQHLFSDTNISNMFKTQDLINFDLFLDSLAITAFYLKYNDQYTHCEKILSLVEKMTKSDGVILSQKKTGKTFNSYNDLKGSLKNIMNKYPDYIAKKSGSASKVVESDFNIIFANMK